eukprot:TRINITY_DN74996_c0_g1_i2.p1 TRINITY_DN74996_c0_g1~~TRINITY_DN74996_c0_g1_i2.p1  ORF type:complete len:120 (+),score=19.05 TRINITY_DN74996_c0_g1_i2:57-362(+)
MAAWDGDQTFDLGDEKGRFEGKAVLLDQTSVNAAIEQLNTRSGDEKIKEALKVGYCVVRSASAGSYFLVWKSDFQETAYTALNVTDDPNYTNEPAQQGIKG